MYAYVKNFIEKNRTHAKKFIKKTCMAGALGAVTVLLGATGLGMIPWFSGASLTVMHIPVVIGCILGGPIVGMGVGAIFGVYSLVLAATRPSGALDPFFVNPLVSILPRMVFPLIAYAIYKLLKKYSELAAIVVSSFAGTIAHTLLVMGMLIVFGAVSWQVTAAVIVANGIPEAAASAVISVAVIASWRGISGRVKKASLEEIDETDEETGDENLIGG